MNWRCPKSEIDYCYFIGSPVDPVCEEDTRQKNPGRHFAKSPYNVSNLTEKKIHIGAKKCYLSILVFRQQVYCLIWQAKQNLARSNSHWDMDSRPTATLH